MLTRTIIGWLVFVSIAGFLVGGTFVWSLTVPAVCQTEQQAANPDPHKECKTQAEEHTNLSKWWDWTTEDPAAFYTFVLCFLTVLLIGVTGILGVGTFIAAHAAKDAALHIPRVERAYLFGGPTKIELFAGSGKTDFRLTVDNSGKTQAILKEICVSYFQTLPDGPPQYPNQKVAKPDVVIPGGALQIEIPTKLGLDQVTPFFVAGYFKYLDIFRETRTSRFCIRIIPDTEKFEPAGSEAWNDWD